MIIPNDLKKNLTRVSLPVVIAFNGSNHFCPTYPLDPRKLNMFHVSVLGDLLACCKVACSNINKDMLTDQHKQSLALFSQHVDLASTDFQDPGTAVTAVAASSGVIAQAPPVVQQIPLSSAQPDPPSAPKKKKVYKCRAVDCDKVFSRTNGRKVHEYKAHNMGTGWFCDVADCEEAKKGHCFSGPASLKKHKESIHENVWAYVCKELDEDGNECGWGTNQKEAIPLHDATHGKETGHHECPHCGKTFKADLTLKNHVRSGTCRKGKNFFCDIGPCKRGYKDQAGLTQHQQETHGAPGGGS